MEDMKNLYERNIYLNTKFRHLWSAVGKTKTVEESDKIWNELFGLSEEIKNVVYQRCVALAEINILPLGKRDSRAFEAFADNNSLLSRTIKDDALLAKLKRCKKTDFWTVNEEG